MIRTKILMDILLVGIIAFVTCGFIVEHQFAVSKLSIQQLCLHLKPQQPQFFFDFRRNGML